MSTKPFVLPFKPRRVYTAKVWAQSEEIIKRYVDGEDALPLSKIYGVSQPLIFKMLRLNGIRIRPHSEWSKHKVNKDYFAKIDTHEKAQILGFIYADGCVAENRGSYKLIIQLHEQDREYLEYIRNALGYTGPLYEVKARVANHVALVIHCKKLCEDLIRLGAMPRKTFLLEFPTREQVPEEFVSSFILGFFEGDGSINTASYFQGKKKPKWYRYTRLNFVGRLNMLEAIKDRLSVTNKIEKRRNIYSISFVKLDSVKRCINYLYSGATFALKRKYLRALHLIDNPRFHYDQTDPII